FSTAPSPTSIYTLSLHDALPIFERDPDFRSFTFDGQTIAIQDYLEKRQGDRARVEALVGADRLLVGPWHVLADLLLVSGESRRRDRKSTRLNSSHVEISYAVFCL